MKKNHSKSKAALAALLGMTALMGQAQAKPQAQSKDISQYEATLKKEAKKAKASQATLEDLLSSKSSGQFGLTPKEYGIRFGTGKSRSKKSNRLRYTANAKLKRSKSC